MTWVIAWRGQAWTEDDLLAGDLATVQALTDGTWVECNPWRGPVELMAMIATLAARTEHRDVQAVLDEIRLSPAAEVQQAIARRD